MNDEAYGRQERNRGVARQNGLADQAATTDSAGSLGGPSLEQQYANAVEAMNRIVSSLDFEPLSWVTEIFRVTAGMLSETDPARAGVLNNLGSAAQLAHLRDNDLGDLEDAVGYYRAAASTAAEDDVDRVLYQANLALALTDQASKTGDAQRAEEAVDTARSATESTPRRDPRRVLLLVRLGNALKTHAKVARNTGADDESIGVFREAARFAAPQDRVELLINLGSALLRRYERRGSIEDLDDGIDQFRAGVDGMADGEPRRIALCHLSNALRLRFQRIGDMGDLYAAINELTGVLDVLDQGHHLTGRIVWGLACATAEHADSTGEPELLRRVLRSMDPAVRALAVDDANQSMALSGFGAILRRHFLHGSTPNALDTAVAAGQAAVRAAGRDIRRCAALNSLASTLISRYEHNGNVPDLDRASEAATEASELAPAATAPLHTAWAQLGIIAAHHYHRDSASESLDTSIQMLDKALNAMPTAAPERAAVANHLGRSLLILHQRLGRRRPYRWARKVLMDAAGQETAPSEHRLRAAGLCGRLAAQAHRWSEALESFSTAIELLPLVTCGKRVVASPRAQQAWSTLASDAAACALENGEPERAVELLEHGRAAVLADFLPSGGELGDLHRKQPALASRVVRLRRLLDRPAEETSLTELDFEETEERSRRAGAWDALMHEIRALAEHQNHLRITPFAELAPTGDQGPVVLVNLSRYRSDALIVFGGRVLTIPLPDATPDATTQRASTALAASRGGDQRAMTEALDWIWQHITRPVLDRMGYVGQPGEGQRWPRLWWCVNGAPAFLPLHAATSKAGDSVLDRVISSYTPTLRTLLRALRTPVPDGGKPLVAGSSADRVSHGLPASNRILAQYWPTADVVSGEAIESGAGDGLVGLLPEHPWVHICAASAQDPAHPAAGVLIDREPPARPTGLMDLGPVILDQAEFSYLGRIRTVGDTPTSAGVPLIGALGFAGFTHVIGTLWETDKDTADQVHAEVYEDLFSGQRFDTDSAALALHSAAFRIRAQSPSSPTKWAAHVHVGP